MDCSVCNKKAEPAFSVTHRTCGHSTHADCIVGDSVPKLCNACLNPGEKISAAALIQEPHTKDGVDYVSKPGVKSKGWSSLGVGTAVVSLITRKPSVPPPKTALELVREGTPILDLFKKYGYGLDHLLKEGVTIDDLLVARYKWDDICMFDDISRNGPHRSLDTFVKGLKMTANHLRDNPDRLPFEAFKKLTNLESPHLCTRLGMEFPELDSLQCCDDKEWSAKDCVRFGLTMDDLISFGLNAEEQYISLMKGLTQKEREEAEKRLGVTEKHLSGLRNLAQEEKEVAVVQFIQEEQEEKEEEEEEEEIVEPPKRVAKPKPVKPLVVRPKKDNLAHLGYVPSRKK